jgi:predicted dehydrogenase
VSDLKVAIVGAGFGRRVVAPVYASTDGCDVIDVVSARDDDAVRRLTTRSDVDIVSVHSPPFLHAPHVRLALAAGKTVVCDKPFALDADEAAALEAEARDAQVIALCNFEFRYAPARALLREMVHDGTVGPVQHVQSVHLSAGSRVPLRQWGWLFDRALGGGWVGAWASHAVDGLRYLFGAEVTHADAVLRIDVPERPDADGELHACTAEDGLQASLVLDTGVTVAIDSSFAAVANTTPRFTVTGTNAVVECVADERLVVRRADGSPETINLAGDEPAADRHLEPMRRLVEVVRDAMRTGEVPAHAPTFADGCACDAVLDQLRAAPFAHELVES